MKLTQRAIEKCEDLRTRARRAHMRAETTGLTRWWQERIARLDARMARLVRRANG